MVCIGDQQALYYCFPQTGGDVVAKTRLAAEELYKLKRASQKRGRKAVSSGEEANAGSQPSLKT